LDITSLSSYSQQNAWVEWGYNRDGDNLQQINLGVLLGDKNKLSFFYQIYPDSIAYVSTPNNIVLRAKDLGFRIKTWIMDHGFFSASNLEHLVRNGYKFITAMPSTLKIAHTLFTNSTVALCSPITSFCLGKEVLSSCDTSCTIGALDFRVCIYLSDKRGPKKLNLLLDVWRR
jgi:transposase